MCLQKDEAQTEEVSFEVIETNVRCSHGNAEETIIIYFDSSAKPEYAALCDLPGNSLCFPISSIDKERGYIIVPEANWSEYYCKVVFKGDFGRIINRPIRVN